jgi:hypothetical protein
MSTINITSKAVAFSDSPQSGNQPLRKNFDWTRSLSLSVSSPKSYEQEIGPGGSATFFSGVRSVGSFAVPDTGFNVIASPLAAGRYRFTYSGQPPFRTDRGLTLSTHPLTVAVNSDSTATMTLGSGNWGTADAGDIVFIPGVSTGDSAGPLNILNEGFWVVLALAGEQASSACARPARTSRPVARP